MLYDFFVWERVNAVAKGLFLTLEHSSADDNGCFASVALPVLVRGNFHVCYIPALVSANIMPGICIFLF